MARLDPYTQRFPTNVELLNKNGTMNKAWIDWFNYDNLWKQQIFKRTGGGDDLILEGEQVSTSIGSRVSRNAARIDGLEFIRFRVVEVTADHTAAPFEIVICNNIIPITVTLEPDALIEDQIYVKRKQNAKKVTVLGSIDGKTSRVINVKKWADFYVFGETEWAVI